MKLQLVVSPQTNPYINVAVENYLLATDSPDTVTLYLWKNRRTVVIGQNQNPYSECQVETLQNEGGFVMRRKTGGGAVYHDDGNINFSFVAPHDLYDQMRQFSVIQKAVSHFGLETSVSGRNDLLCDGRKFSGNAFAKGRTQNLHHGTILIRTNVEDLERYLLVKPSKLKKHGVKSVQSRVVNLSELAPVTSQNIVPYLVMSFEEVYGQKVEELDFNYLAKLLEVEALRKEFESPEWLFGKWKNFKAQKSAQFDWGLVEVGLDVDQEKGIISNLTIATDSLDLELEQQCRTLWVGCSIEEPPQKPDSTQLAEVWELIFQ